MRNVGDFLKALAELRGGPINADLLISIDRWRRAYPKETQVTREMVMSLTELFATHCQKRLGLFHDNPEMCQNTVRNSHAGFQRLEAVAQEFGLDLIGFVFDRPLTKDETAHQEQFERMASVRAQQSIR